MSKDTIGKNTKITIGTVSVVITCLFSIYRGVLNDFNYNLDTKVDKEVYKAERENVEARITSLEKETLIRFKQISSDIVEIKELLKEDKYDR